MPRLLQLIRLLLLALPLTASAAESLYAASVRTLDGSDRGRVAGNLYRVDPAAGRYSLIGALRVNPDKPIAVTGIADHPVTGVLYGVTSDLSPNDARSLVTIDVETAVAVVIGPLGADGSDLAFDSHGNLFAWLRETSQLALIDIATGAAMPIGQPRNAGEIGGLTIDARDRMFVASTGATGTLDTIDPGTGAVTTGPALRDAPYPGGINSLTMAPSGDILAVNTNLGSPALTMLVRIDPSTGRITKVASLPDDTDALVFVNVPWSIKAVFASRGAITLAAAIVLACAVVAALLVSRRKRVRGRDGDGPGTLSA
jgi:hypothetical protein